MTQTPTPRTDAARTECFADRKGFEEAYEFMATLAETLERELAETLAEIAALRSAPAPDVGVAVLPDALRTFAEGMAEGECHYGDGCPLNAGTRHGECDSCKARRALAAEAKAPKVWDAETIKDAPEGQYVMMDNDWQRWGHWTTLTVDSARKGLNGVSGRYPCAYGPLPTPPEKE